MRFRRRANFRRGRAGRRGFRRRGRGGFRSRRRAGFRRQRIGIRM